MNYSLITSLFIFLGLIYAEAQDKPKKAYVLHEAAEAAYNQGKYTESLNLLNECITTNAGYMEAYALRASVREALKDYDGALVDYSIYLDKIPAHPEVLMSRAVLRYKIGFYQQAKEDFHALLHITSGETNAVFYKQNMSVDDRNPVMTTQGAHRSYVYNYLGLTASKLKDFKQALKYLDTAIQYDNCEPDYFVNRGLVKEALNDSTAIIDYERALRLNPEHTLAKHNLDALNARKVQTMSLEERLSRTIEADSTMLYPYLERAQQRYESGYYKGAAEDYTRALEIDQSNVEIWLGRGLAREKLKDYDGAFSDYTKAIELKNDYAKAWLNRGNVLLKLERFDDAVEDYTVALLYYPDYPLAFYNRAIAKLKLKQNNEACADILQAELLGLKIEKKVKDKACN